MSKLFPLILGSLILLAINSSVAQQQEDEKKEVIQLAGVVLDEDSIGVPGVHIYTPVYGRGTSTNAYGFFSMPVLEGDSLIITAVGFKRAKYIVPKIDGQTLKVSFKLKVDTEVMNEVKVYNLPPTPDAFKKALVNMSLPQEYESLNQKLDAATMQELMRRLPPDGSSNHRWFVQQQAFYNQTRTSVRMNPLLNPMAWRDLFRAIKRGDFKNGGND